MWRKMNTPNIIYWMNVLSLIRFVDVWENISFSWKHLIRYHTNHVVTLYICVYTFYCTSVINLPVDY